VEVPVRCYKHQHSLLARKVLPPPRGGSFFGVRFATMATPSEIEAIPAISLEPVCEDFPDLLPKATHNFLLLPGSFSGLPGSFWALPDSFARCLGLLLAARIIPGLPNCWPKISGHSSLLPNPYWVCPRLFCGCWDVCVALLVIVPVFFGRRLASID
jgi:hypothetical protein